MTKREAERAVVRAAMRVATAWNAWDAAIENREEHGGSPMEYLDERIMDAETRLEKACARLAARRKK